jgi:hypothetical protein
MRKQKGPNIVRAARAKEASTSSHQPAPIPPPPDRSKDDRIGIEHLDLKKKAIFILTNTSTFPALVEWVLGLACTRFRRHRVRCFDGTGGGSWRDGSLRESSSLRRCA